VVSEIKNKNNNKNNNNNNNNNNIKYGFKMANKTETDKIRSDLYRLEKIDKPIKSMSSYKVDELAIICEKLSIDTVNKMTGKKKTKKDLYETIIQYF
jgi:hypothetical protein